MPMLAKPWLIGVVLALIPVIVLFTAPNAIVSPHVLDIGDTYGNQMVSAQFQIFNLGLRPIYIDSYKGSCTCEKFYGPDVIWPLRYYPLSVTIKSRGVNGPYKVGLAVIMHNAQSQILEIYGNRIILCRTDPAAVNFSLFDKVDENTLSQDLLVEFSQPVPTDRMTFTTEDDRLKVIPITKFVGNLNQVHLKLVYNSNGIRGDFRNWVKINYFLGHDSEYTVDVTGRLPGGLELSPSQVDLNQDNILKEHRYSFIVKGLTQGETINAVNFSSNVPKKACFWNIDSNNHLNLQFNDLYLMSNIQNFSLLAETSKGQTATVYFSK